MKKLKHSSAAAAAGGGGKSGSTSLPSSDCELKIAARVKELKGKARGKLPNILSTL